jgi:uncharacterized membrane protein
MKANWLQHNAFRAGIGIKGFDGLVEVAGGVLLWFVKPSSFAWLETFWLGLLAQDRHDFIAVHMLRISERLTGSDPAFASFYLLSHGLVKVVLAIALWMNEIWAYPLAIAVFSAFCIYQVYRFSFTHSEALIWLTIFDIGVVILTWKEYRLQARSRKAARSAVGVSVSDRSTEPASHTSR